jgi:hypothetical protein
MDTNVPEGFQCIASILCVLPILLEIYVKCSILYKRDAQNHWVSKLRPLSGILKTMIRNDVSKLDTFLYTGDEMETPTSVSATYLKIICNYHFIYYSVIE